MKYSKGDTIFDKNLGKWMTFDGEKLIPEKEWIEKRDGKPPEVKVKAEVSTPVITVGAVKMEPKTSVPKAKRKTPEPAWVGGPVVSIPAKKPKPKKPEAPKAKKTVSKPPKKRK